MAERTASPASRSRAAGGPPARGSGARSAASQRLGFDPRRAAAHLRAADPALAKLMEAAGPLRLELKATPDVFGALAEAIVHQQLSTQVCEAIYGRLRALFPRSAHGPTPRGILRASDEKLRSAGLSGAKILALRDLARHASAGAIPSLAEMRSMDDEAIVERLVVVRGIGRWTAEMLLIFRLGRPDVLPLDDFGVRKGFQLAFGATELPRRGELAARGERWRPYRTAASWYLWRALELGRS